MRQEDENNVSNVFGCPHCGNTEITQLDQLNNIKCHVCGKEMTHNEFVDGNMENIELQIANVLKGFEGEIAAIFEGAFEKKALH